MERLSFNPNTLKTPCYLVDEALLTKNLEILKSVAHSAGCKILLAQKAFSMFRFYPLIGKYLDGASSSGLFEAKLAHEYMKGENHIFSPAYKRYEMDEIVSICDHVIFNSAAQYLEFKDMVLSAGKECGVRINPQHSTQGGGIYDPCAQGSRLGITSDAFNEELFEGVSGLHFHTLCEQNSDALVSTYNEVERRFGGFFNKIKWINLGGGHHITRNDYDIETLVSCVKGIREKYGLAVYLEPGEAVALNCGFLVSTVIDIVENEIKTAVLDASAACHMPDVLEMPYRPEVIGAGKSGEKRYTYRLGGPTCLAGDIIGDYSFDYELKAGDKLVFCDMAIYSMVKNNTFNGIRLPDIAVVKKNGETEVIRTFGYDDFKNRLS
ncbi:MAG: Carboxynorspermidine/carboxyspermidine decarboxylase [Firmicutes bacterium ADurb.Bin193]|nr:MAG: Carboxynorspermidine/carboxyspermidine decarboxylase [Firmicutes bacterium ADurb.Bin193]